MGLTGEDAKQMLKEKIEGISKRIKDKRGQAKVQARWRELDKERAQLLASIKDHRKEISDGLEEQKKETQLMADVEWLEANTIGPVQKNLATVHERIMSYFSTELRVNALKAAADRAVPRWDLFERIRLQGKHNFHHLTLL